MAKPLPVAAVVFYRALVQAANLAPVDALIAALRRQGLNPLPVFVSSLKDPVSAATVERLFAEANEMSRPLLKREGFVVVGTETVVRRGVRFRRYLVERRTAG